MPVVSTFCMSAFRRFAIRFLLSNAYSHSKQTLDLLQTTIVKIVKKESAFIWKVAYGQVVYTQESKKLCESNLVKSQLC